MWTNHTQSCQLKECPSTVPWEIIRVHLPSPNFQTSNIQTGHCRLQYLHKLQEEEKNSLIQPENCVFYLSLLLVRCSNPTLHRPVSTPHPANLCSIHKLNFHEKKHGRKIVLHTLRTLLTMKFMEVTCLSSSKLNTKEGKCTQAPTNNGHSKHPKVENICLQDEIHKYMSGNDGESKVSGKDHSYKKKECCSHQQWVNMHTHTNGHVTVKYIQRKKKTQRVVERMIQEQSSKFCLIRVERVTTIM